MKGNTTTKGILKGTTYGTTTGGGAAKDVELMKVSELRKELSKRSLSTKGIKTVLQTRLTLEGNYPPQVSYHF